ncbi:sodium:proton antiporter [soil metagenome]
MDFFLLFSVLITIAAGISYINIRLFKLPQGIALMIMGMFLSLGLIIAGKFSPSFASYIRAQISSIDFSEFLLGTLLSFLLFAGSMHVNYQQLKSSAKSVLIFSTFGVLISTFLTGITIYYLLGIFGIAVPFLACLLFGSLISPTDPIAVLGILKKAKVSESVEIKITGESLFNDGVGVVVFATILQIMHGTDSTSAGSIILLFGREAIGGILIGLIIGYVGYKLMKSIDHFQTEIMITLAMVMGGYSLCHELHVSGPLAMVVAGLLTGTKGVAEAMSDTTREYVEKFWEVLDEIFNAILFLLIGLELVIFNLNFTYILFGILVAVLLVGIRYISLWFPAVLFRFKKTLEDKTLTIMTWGGLRGGISIALALSLPEGEFKNLFVTITYVVVLFSILVQGLSLGKLAKQFQTISK